MEALTLFQYIMKNAISITQLITIIVLVISLWITYKEFQRSNKVRKQDIYTKLELSSIELFKIAIDHPEIEKIYDAKIEKDISDIEKERLLEYTACLLNLFEIQFNLRLSGDIEPVIFGSWMPWFYDLCRTSYFKEVWKNLQKHYTPRFREFINSLINTIDTASESEKEKMFYEKASQLMGDDEVIKNWLKGIE
ncbi:MAG TPA: hypothetical protein ENI33_05955 [Thermoplasmatales archaeon]|nr:hypothetical protein [Thermoplasmatales archaeon]